MSNGPVMCCLIGSCCKPPERVAALARELWRADQISDHSLAAERADHPRYVAMAEHLLAKVDLVPKGLGDAILAAYTPNIAHAIKEGKL